MPLKSPRSPSCFSVCMARVLVAKRITLLLLLYNLPYFHCGMWQHHCLLSGS